MLEIVVARVQIHRSYNQPSGHFELYLGSWHRQQCLFVVMLIDLEKTKVVADCGTNHRVDFRQGLDLQIHVMPSNLLHQPLPKHQYPMLL